MSLTLGATTSSENLRTVSLSISSSSVNVCSDGRTGFSELATASAAGDGFAYLAGVTENERTEAVEVFRIAVLLCTRVRDDGRAWLESSLARAAAPAGSDLLSLRVDELSMVVSRVFSMR